MKMSVGKWARIIIIGFWVIAIFVMYFFIPDYRGDWKDIFEIVFILSAYSLCWVGFPVGWRWLSGVRENSYGNDTAYGMWCIISFFVGVITMAFSVPIAIFQILFKWD